MGLFRRQRQIKQQRTEMYTGFEFKRRLITHGGVDFDSAEASTFAAFPLGGPGTRGTQVDRTLHAEVEKVAAHVAADIEAAEDVPAARKIARAAIRRYLRLAEEREHGLGDESIAASVLADKCRKELTRIDRAERREAGK